jgi:hypothetical protein
MPHCLKADRFNPINHQTQLLKHLSSHQPTNNQMNLLNIFVLALVASTEAGKGGYSSSLMVAASIPLRSLKYANQRETEQGDAESSTVPQRLLELQRLPLFWLLEL